MAVNAETLPTTPIFGNSATKPLTKPKQLTCFNFNVALQFSLHFLPHQRLLQRSTVPPLQQPHELNSAIPPNFTQISATLSYQLILFK